MVKLSSSGVRKTQPIPTRMMAKFSRTENKSFLSSVSHWEFLQR